MTSRAISGNEKCVFCGWTRRNAYQSVRFFCIPKEPGLKRVRWLQVFGDREISAKDRVCSVHFRQGRPSSDFSHEDFVPHLYLNDEPPAEVMEYLESLADTNTKLEKATNAPVNKPTFLSVDGVPSGLMKMSTRSTKPSILKRKKLPKDDLYNEEDEEINVVEPPPTVEREPEGGEEFAEAPAETSAENEDVVEPTPPTISPQRPVAMPPPPNETKEGMRLTLIERSIVDTVGMKPGQTVIIRRKVKKQKVLMDEAEKQGIIPNE